jgi:hypothetical protein
MKEMSMLEEFKAALEKAIETAPSSAMRSELRRMLSGLKTEQPAAQALSGGHGHTLPGQD